jgi:hypothetical protein
MQATHVTYWIGGVGGLRARSDAVQKKKYLGPGRNRTTVQRQMQSVARRYTDYKYVNSRLHGVTSQETVPFNSNTAPTVTAESYNNAKGYCQ